MELTQAVVRELLNYNEKTGSLIWRRRDQKWFKTDRDCKIWNTRFAEKQAFVSVDAREYYFGCIFYKNYRAHRIIWLWMTGRWPNSEVDHENHIKTDNRWSNLFEKTHKDNMRNKSLQRNSTSGYTGVYWYKRNKCWQTCIVVNDRQIHLGYFDILNEAIAARKSAEEKFGFHANHGLKR